MRAYFISIMVACTISLAITGIVFSGSLLSVIAPESSLPKSTFAKYNHLDQYIEITKYHSSKEHSNDYKNLSDEEWKVKWEQYRTAKISSEKHDGIGGIYSSIISFIIFGVLMVMNYILFRKFNSKNIILT